jgi:hypothetical protein
MDALVGGNFYNVNPFQGIYDGFNGLILKNTPSGFIPLTSNETGFLIKGEVRDIKTLKTAKGNEILVTRNNQSVLRFKTIF